MCASERAHECTRTRFAVAAVRKCYAAAAAFDLFSCGFLRCLGSDVTSNIGVHPAGTRDRMIGLSRCRFVSVANTGNHTHVTPPHRTMGIILENSVAYHLWIRVSDNYTSYGEERFDLLDHTRGPAIFDYTFRACPAA